MLHAPHDHNRPDQTLERDGATCARCGRSMPVTRAGTVKTGTRFCTARCRTADVRDRRAAARADLLDALDDLRALENRMRAVLAVMGHTKL
jgi:endogenous inhibitor of DNA gyrase (YacG/DUF329 family)